MFETKVTGSAWLSILRFELADKIITWFYFQQDFIQLYHSNWFR